jgi:negative regulator of genetic competence, sporulation and motility
MVPCISDDNNEQKTNQKHNSLKIIKTLLRFNDFKTIVHLVGFLFIVVQFRSSRLVTIYRTTAASFSLENF